MCPSAACEGTSSRNSASASWRKRARCTALLSGNGRDLRWQLVDKQVLELNFSARVIDIDSDEVTFRIVVEHDPFGNLPTFHTRLLRKVDIQRIRRGVVIQLHGLNPLSGKALWIVTFSCSVTTHKWRPSSSRQTPQKRKRLFSCGSSRIGFSTTRMHHSFLRYGRLRRTSFSKYSVKRYSVM